MCLSQVKTIHLPPLPERKKGVKMVYRSSAAPEFYLLPFRALPTDTARIKVGETYNAIGDTSKRTIFSESLKEYPAGFHILVSIEDFCKYTYEGSGEKALEVEYWDVVAEGVEFVGSGRTKEANIVVARSMRLIREIPLEELWPKE